MMNSVTGAGGDSRSLVPTISAVIAFAANCAQLIGVSITPIPLLLLPVLLALFESPTPALDDDEVDADDKLEFNGDSL
jgi:hypothetical protein